MEIKNKLINTKEYKRGIRLNKKMRKKTKKYENPQKILKKQLTNRDFML